MNDLTVRLATVDDLAWWASVEHLPPDLVKRTIEGEEALIAELAGQPVGYVRIEYLWSAAFWRGSKRYFSAKSYRIALTARG